MTYIFRDLGRSWSFFRKRFGEQRQNTFREPRQLFSGIWGDQCIIFRDQGSTDPPGGLRNVSGNVHNVLTQTRLFSRGVP